MRSVVAIVWLVWAALMSAQEALDNNAILKLVKAGVSESVILAMLSNQPGTYSLAADDVIKLKSAGVPDAVVAAMIERQSSAVGRSHQSPDLSSRNAKTSRLGAASHPFWNETPVSQWSEEDARRLLAD